MRRDGFGSRFVLGGVTRKDTIVNAKIPHTVCFLGNFAISSYDTKISFSFFKFLIFGISLKILGNKSFRFS